MRDLGTKIFSILMMSTGLGIMLWVSTGLLSPARSQVPDQQQPPAQAAPTAVQPTTPTQPQAPTEMELPPDLNSQLTPEEQLLEAERQFPELESQQQPQAAPQPTAELPLSIPPPEAFPGGVVQPQSEGFSYDPTGLRDPFQPFSPPPPETPEVITPQFVQSQDPLQNFDLSQLRVVGIIWGVPKPRAMVRDPAGKIHMVFKETKMGRYGGFIAEIREGEIVVVEPTRSSDGLLTGAPRILGLTK
jgi:type IV pilus assembly protein PilP